MPVIQTSADPGLEDFVSVMGDGLLRKADAFGHRRPCARADPDSGRGQWPNVIVALHLSLPPTRTFASVIA